MYYGPVKPTYIYLHAWFSVDDKSRCKSLALHNIVHINTLKGFYFENSAIRHSPSYGQTCKLAYSPDDIYLEVYGLAIIGKNYL